MPEDSDLVYCYNLGCEAKKFNPKDNNEKACRHHTSPPFFHDAYKGWSCCKKKVTDFTELFNIKGCAVGPHNPNKPEKDGPGFVREHGEEPVLKMDDTKKDPAKFISAPDPEAHMTRPKGDDVMSSLSVEISKALQTALLKKTDEEKKVEETTDKETIVQEAHSVQVGTNCKRNACKTTYLSEESNDGACWHHPGIPVFHEGMKYWSCCNRKTSDFDAWEQQTGCTQGTHAWSMEDAGKKSQPCRFDWHQTPTHVFFTMYAKNSVPASSNFEANSARLTINLSFDFGANNFMRDVHLWHGINVSESKVSFTPNKVEVQMRKTVGTSWARLDLPPKVETEKDDNQS